MKRSLLLIALTLGISMSALARPGHPLEHQMVTVRVTYQTWNEYRPWQKDKPRTHDFVGTVISSNRILMLTDDLADATLIQVEKFDRPPRVPAKVLHCDYQANLALITVDAPGFFDDLTPVELAENTDGETYYSAAWKSGQLSLSACRWSKASVYDSWVPYFSHVGISFITDMTDGGRGEPVFSGNKLIGITYSQNDTRSWVLPVEQVQAYLHAVDLPVYPGFAALGIDYQVNKGPAQAAYEGLQGPPTGIMIRQCLSGGSADGHLLPDDVLLELDGHAIDSLGDYVHPRYGTMKFTLIATDGHYAGDVISATVLRNKEKITVDIPLKQVPPSTALIPHARPGIPPDYLVAGGFIFRELDVPYLKAWGSKWEEKIPPYLRYLYKVKSESETPEQRRLIVLADVFPDEYNLGYHDMAQNIVSTVNGQPVDSIQKMEEAFRHPQNGFHVIEFVPTYGTTKVVLDANTFDVATEAIMKKYEIPTRIRVQR